MSVGLNMCAAQIQYFSLSRCFLTSPDNYPLLHQWSYSADHAGHWLWSGIWHLRGIPIEIWFKRGSWAMEWGHLDQSIFLPTYHLGIQWQVSINVVRPHLVGSHIHQVPAGQHSLLTYQVRQDLKLLHHRRRVVWLILYWLNRTTHSISGNPIHVPSHDDSEILNSRIMVVNFNWAVKCSLETEAHPAEVVIIVIHPREYWQRSGSSMASHIPVTAEATYILAASAFHHRALNKELALCQIDLHRLHWHGSRILTCSDVIHSLVPSPCYSKPSCCKKMMVPINNCLFDGSQPHSWQSWRWTVTRYLNSTSQ